MGPLLKWGEPPRDQEIIVLKVIDQNTSEILYTWECEKRTFEHSEADLQTGYKLTEHIGW